MAVEINMNTERSAEFKDYDGLGGPKRGRGYYTRGWHPSLDRTLEPMPPETENPRLDCEGKRIIKDPNSKLKVYTRYIFCPSCRGSGRRNGNGAS